MADEHDVDPQETREWLEALHSVLEKRGHRARPLQLIERLIDEMRRSGAHLPYKATTAYVNTIRKSDEPSMPGRARVSSTASAPSTAGTRWPWS